MLIHPLKASLTDSYMISPKVKHFIIQLKSMDFNYTPGQFITLHFDYDNKPLRRSYSIANLEPKNNMLEFAAGYVEKGPGTDFLFNLKLNDELNITGPFGRLILRDDIPKRYVFIGTSTGVTPYRCMLHSLAEYLEKNKHLHAALLFGVQKKEDAIYKQDFINFAKQYPSFAFYIFYSRENKATLLDYERLGHVQNGFDEINLNSEEDIVYLCGNPSMIDESFSYLKEKGFTTQQVIREKYISR